MLRSAIDLLLKLWMLACRVLPIRYSKAVFKSDRGQNCGDSPFALFEAFRATAPDKDLVWILNDPAKAPAGSRGVRAGSLAEIRELATAGLWVDNKRKGNWCTKRKGQLYVQTWHGAIALKKIEKDIEDRLPASYIRSCKNDSAMADWFLSGSSWTSTLYRSAFYYDGEILEYGVPRADILHGDAAVFHREVCTHYRLPEDTRIALFAPTFRDGQPFSLLGFDPDRVLDCLASRQPGRWVMLIRLHPNIQAQAGALHFTDRILNGSEHPRINEQIMASEVVITDYSSCMFDAMEAGKPVFLYCPDLERYAADRGTYFTMDELPFDCCLTMDTLCGKISGFDPAVNQSKVETFEKRIGMRQCADSSRRVCDFLLKKLDRKANHGGRSS